MPTEDKPAEPSSVEERVDLESQFILRLPSVPAASLKAAVGSGVMNLKERLTIQVEPDMKHGTVRFDGWVLPAKVVDLPCVLESHKTLDRKNFYKTADICQLMVCKEENTESQEKEEEEGKKTKEGKEKKFLWPHGITPPLKNVRKRRFRKTLKKKYVDFPEIEKEVKRLLRMDNEACNVRYEVVNADDEKNDGKMSANSTLGNSTLGADVGEHDLFGDVVTSSDEDDTRANYSDDNSRLSTTNKDFDTREEADKSSEMITEFSKEMFPEEGDLMKASTSFQDALESSKAAAAVASLEEDNQASSALTRGEEYENSYRRMQEIEAEIRDIQRQIFTQEDEMRQIENLSLKQRFQSIIEDLRKQEKAKREEYEELAYMTKYEYDQS